MKVRKRTLKEEHSDILGSMHNLVIRYSEVSRRQEALQLIKQVMKVNKRTLGEKHSDILGSIYAFIINYSEVGRRQEAL